MKEPSRKPDNLDIAPMGQGLLARVYARMEWGIHWRLYELSRQWPAVVGQEVARLTSPAFFRHDTLWLHVGDAAWMHHLQFIKLDLLTRINRVLTDAPARDLRWQLAPAIRSSPPRRPSQPHAVTPERAEDFARLSGAIANPQCREALRRLWQTAAAHGPEEEIPPRP